MKQAIMIEVPEGKKAVYDGLTKTIRYESIEPVRSKSYPEYVRNHCTAPYYFPSSRYNYSIGLATSEDCNGIIALMKLTRLRDEWVGEWEPDWTSWYDSKTKWCIYRNQFEPSIGSFCTTYNLLSFPTMEMAQEFKDTFKDLLVEAIKFI